jgi:hypothetical protein
MAVYLILNLGIKRLSLTLRDKLFNIWLCKGLYSRATYDPSI